MSNGYDAIVIGAGHNGMTTAGLLAKHGRKVLLLERRDRTGGLAAPEEFHPGYHSAGLLHDTTGVRSAVVRALSLQSHGLDLREARPGLLALGSDGSGRLLPGDPGSGSGDLSPEDARRLVEYRRFIGRVRPVLSGFLDTPPVDLVEHGGGIPWGLIKRLVPLRRLGRAVMFELLRVPPMSVADWLDEWFASHRLKAALALQAVGGSFAGPRSPGTAANLLLWEAAAGPGIRGGGAALASALESAATAAGVEIRRSTPVVRIRVNHGVVAGVRTAEGEEIPGEVVAASCDPKQVFGSLLDAGVVTTRLERQIANVRTRGTTAHVLFALTGRLSFACRPSERIEFARTGDDVDAVERAFEPVKYRELPVAPVLDIHVPTVVQPGLAPDGCDVLSVLVHFVPHDVVWDDDTLRQRLLDRVVSVLERHAPGFSSILARAVLRSPRDVATIYGCTGGQIHHGEPALDQLLVRPAPGCTGYRTPVRGLFLCGSGSHPGGGLTCAPGALAASAIVGRRLF